MAAAKQSDPKVEWNWDDAEMRERWEAFAKFGNANATEITGKNFDKWLKDAGVLDQKRVTTTMTGIAFSKVAGPKRKTLNYNETKKVLAKVADDRTQKSKKSIQEELDAMTEKLANLEAPSVNSAAKTNTKGVYDRMTDHTKYTGAHKERFDAEGKGKGKSGRVEVKDKSGYVSAYKNKDTYDKKHDEHH